jgi:hypothetical protein
MAAKVLESVFRLTAVFTGAAAFSQASNAVKGIEKTTKAANAGFKAMAGAMLAVGAAAISITSVTKYLQDSKKEALAGQKAFDKLGTSLARVGDMQKLELLAPGTIADQQKKLYDLASTMEQVGGIAKTSLAEGFATLSRSFSPQKINDMSAGIQDFVVRIKGLRATSDDVADVMGKVNMAITQGVTRGLVQQKILTAEQEATFKGLVKSGTEAQRAAFFFKILGNQTGETARQFETLDGKIYKNELAWARLQENVGRPMIALEGKLAPVFTKIANAIEPLTEKVADKLIAWFDKMEPQLAALDPLLESLGRGMIAAFGWLEENWDIVEIGLVGITAALIGITGAVVAFVAVAVAPWAGIAAGIAAVSVAIGVLVVEWPKISAAAEAALEATKFLWEPFVKWFYEGVVKPVTRMFGDIGAAMKGEIDWQQTFETAGEEILLIFQNIGRGILGAIGAGLQAAGQIDWGKVLGDAAVLGAQFNTWLLGALNTGIQGALAGIAGINWSKVFDPIMAGFQSIGDSIVNFDWMQVFSPVLSGFLKLADLIKLGDITHVFAPWMETVKKVVDDIVALFADMPSRIGALLGKVGDAIKAPFQSAYNAIAGWFGKGGGVDKAVASSTASANAAQKGGATGSWQRGGLVAHPQIAAIAEAGPEMVIPLSGAAASRSPGLMAQAASMLGMKPRGGEGKTTSVNFAPVINVSAANDAQGQVIGREVEKALDNPLRTLLEELRKAKAEEQRLSIA